MDVSLVLTHQCNLACSYCYAGEHHGRTMGREVIERAVALLYADEPEIAQLGFFGGEPMLAFAAMRHAVERARALAAGRRLLVQVTTNGSLIGEAEAAALVEVGARVTLSIDGVREAHDRQRPRAGGQSSFDAVTRGLRALIDAGGAPDALLVITPDTVAHLEASVAWLWSEGVADVHANLELGATWSEDDREDLRGALLRVGADLVRMRRAGHDVSFAPLERPRPLAAERPRVVVATTGNLYPCAPMVGEDRDGGREAAQRIGHVSEPAADIVARVFAEGVHCSTKGRCACAAYLETGDAARLGPNGAFWSRMCKELTAAVAVELAGEAAPELPAAGALELCSPPREPRRRRSLATGLVLGAGALGFVSASLPGLLRMIHQKRPGSVLAAATVADGAGETQSPAAPAGESDATGVPQQSVLDRVALREALAGKGATPLPIPRPGPPRKLHVVDRHIRHLAGKMPAHHFGNEVL